VVGLIGKKLGMTQIFDGTGKLIPVTVVEVTQNRVLGHKKTEEDGYDALIIGYRNLKKTHITKPYKGQFPEGISPTKIIKEFRNCTVNAEIGAELGVSVFEGTRFVDVIAVSKGKGFQGVVKRYGFKGGRSTHGSKFHREPGSTGQRTFPHKTFKNKKLPGRMGREQVTVQNLRLVKIDAENGYLLVRGAIPGPRNCIVLLRSAVKKAK
jgi:large subunit ribosomal protein L3